MKRFPKRVASYSKQSGVHRFAILAVIAVAATLAAADSAAAMGNSASPCGFVAKGAPWTFKGQKGTAYTVIALGGASCSTARKWVPRLTRERAAFTLKPVTAGWHCSTAGGITTGLTKTGQCTTRGGGIVEWLPKLNK
jgi:hypothetical protein